MRLRIAKIKSLSCSFTEQTVKSLHENCVPKKCVFVVVVGDKFEINALNLVFKKQCPVQ
jgi:hypothetical protein